MLCEIVGKTMIDDYFLASLFDHVKESAKFGKIVTLLAISIQCYHGWEVIEGYTLIRALTASIRS